MLPGTVSNLRNLTLLNLRQNDLTSIPAEFVYMDNLQEVSVRIVLILFHVW